MTPLPKRQSPDLFVALDGFLRRNEKKLKDVFYSFDVSGDGRLDAAVGTGGIMIATSSCALKTLVS